MIARRWIDPNVEFTATDEQGVAHRHFCYTNDKATLQTRLISRGFANIVITDYDFNEWRTRARAATDKAVWQRVRDRWSYFQQQAKDNWPWLTNSDLAEIDGLKKGLVAKIADRDGLTEAEATTQVDSWSVNLAEETPAVGQILPKTAINFNQAIWKELKWHLFDLFHGKCAYCENKSLAGYAGDVEHYRPKGKVDEDPNHPGYYWLAYDEHNLLPSCSLCNQPSRAKRTHFPVQGANARDARGIPAENPLLLNPYTIDPFAHLEFDGAGFARPRNTSLLGEMSRKIYDLDRNNLKEARFQAMQRIAVEWQTRISRNVTIIDAYKDLRDQLLTGVDEYSAAQLWELKRVKERTIQGLESFPEI